MGGSKFSERTFYSTCLSPVGNHVQSALLSTRVRALSIAPGTRYLLVPSNLSTLPLLGSYYYFRSILYYSSYPCRVNTQYYTVLPVVLRCTTRGRTYEILSTETYLLYQYVYYQYFWMLPESSRHFQIFHWILPALLAATPAADIG